MARTKKDPTAPKKQRWYHNVAQAYSMASKTDKALPWWIAAAMVATIALGLVIGLIVKQPVYFLILGVMFSLIAGMAVLARRAERAAYAQIEGQPGAALSALKTIRRGWTFADEPVAIDPRTQDVVFRGVGRPGIVLVTEGPPQRAARLADAERKKLARILPNVTITVVQSGRAEGQVPLPKLASKVRKIRPPKGSALLTKPELAQVNARLNALGAVRPPIPKGVDPMRARPDRKGMRGR
jgi:F0F1-type ATP synthase assembly protein I